ncbi:MAG: LCP family protein [Chloroflexi bacterium]|nr:LCP family protein [Chloroflexota bacterium]
MRDRRRREYREFSPSTKGAVRPGRRSRGLSIVFPVVFSLFVLGGLYFGCLFLTKVSSVFSWIPVPRPSAPILGIDFGSGDSIDALPMWTGTDRVNILLLGLDQREDERGQPTRSDTLIVLTIDPVTKSAGVLSIPRDLWASIPGHGQNKINTAYFFGEVEKRGNGPALAKRAVQELLGIPLHNYALVDFQGFERLIDAIGGVVIDVDRPVKDDEYPSSNYGVMRVYIPAGLQRMDGRTALQYARSRHSDSDIYRMKRQQKVLFAARSQALQLNLLPRLPTLLNTLRQSIQTDLSATDILSLARLAKDFDTKNIVSKAIDESMIADVNRDGSVLVANKQDLSKLLNELFSDPRLKEESARIEVQNGTERSGLAGAVANKLRGLGYTITRIGNATADYKETVIIDYGDKKRTVKTLTDVMKVTQKNVRSSSSADNVDVDILIILGQDAQTP